MENYATKIEMRDLGSLRPYAGNPRKHSRNQIRQLAKSFKKFGFVVPLLVTEDGEIIAGHGRFEAAKLLGVTELPVVCLSHLTPDERRAYVIADNKLAQNAGWDNEVLAIELDALSSAGLEIEVLGFSTAEIDLIFETAAEAKTALPSPEDSIPAVDATALVSRSGDLWTMGDHILACGDARDQSAYGNILKGEKATLVITDPPYNVKIDRNVAGHGSIRYREFGMAAGEMSEPQFTDFLRTICVRLVENSIDGSIHYIFMDWRHMQELLAAGGPIYSELKNVCVWNKTNGGLGSFYRSKHELILVWKAGTAGHINNFGLGQHGRVRTNVWDYAGINTFRKGRMDELALHPTVKPVALVADAIKDCSRRGDIVLDPFCGSGTILIAAEKTGRQARAIEIDPIYVDTAVKRWEAYTGKFATLFGTNDTFELIAERRKQLAPVLV